LGATGDGKVNGYTHWIEIDLDALRHNLQKVRELLPEGVKLLAVVKADAYGLGAGPVSRFWEEQGVDMLGVTNLEEGMVLRQEGVTLPILLFAPMLPHEAPLVVEYGLTPTVDSPEAVQALKEEYRGENIPVHIKVETGMGRTGLKPEQVLPFCQYIKEGIPHIYLEGIFTHFAQAAQGDPYTKTQLRRFREVVGLLENEGIRIPLKHVANSVATLDIPDTHFDMVRVGTVLYGQHPPALRNRIPLENPWQPKARILHIQELDKGDSVGYGRDYRVKKATRIGVIPFGYAEGLGVSPISRPKNITDLVKSLAKTVLAYWGVGPHALKARHGKYVLPFAGRLGMQLSMIEIGDLPLQENDIVEVPLGRITANPDLPRVYLQDGQVIGERSFARKKGLVEA
jgi:alanine racemase